MAKCLLLESSRGSRRAEVLTNISLFYATPLQSRPKDSLWQNITQSNPLTEAQAASILDTSNQTLFEGTRPARAPRTHSPYWLKGQTTEVLLSWAPGRHGV